MKFDVILANPPYDNGLHERFEIKFFDLCNGQIIWIAPLSWLIGKRQNKKITKYVDKFYTDIETINDNEYFDARIAGILGIVYVNLLIEENNIYYNKLLFNKSENIKFYSDDNKLITIKNKLNLENLTDNIQNHCYRNENTLVFNKVKICKNPNKNWWIFKLRAFSGSIRNNKYDFYTIISNNIPYNKICGKYKNIDNVKCYILFDTEIELKNFYKYIQTYFARICLYFIKLNLHIDRGELTYIPWFNFNDDIFNKSIEDIDITLFKKFNITNDLIHYILQLLPNYYNLDLSKYKSLEK